MVSSDDQLSGLVQGLLRNIPRRKRATAIRNAAVNNELPSALPLAIYAIESSFRPWWVRLIENLYLYVSVAWWLCTGLGFRNVTVGPFQIGCHWVAEAMGMHYTRKKGLWRPAGRSLRLACALLRLPCFGRNLDMAMYRLKRLWPADVGTHSFIPVAAIGEAGRRYNGTVWYGEILMILFGRLSRITK